MSNCKHCGKPIEEHTGRNKRKYCSKECRTTYLNANKPKKRAMVKLLTHEKVLKENEALKALVAELRKNNPVLDRGEKNNLKFKAPIEKLPIKIIENNSLSSNIAVVVPESFDGKNFDKYLADEIGQFAVIETKTNHIPATLAELKSMCPPELKGFDKSNWIATERVKYGL